MIRRVGEKWALYTRDGKRRLGTHDSKADALAQERAIETSKHGKGKDDGTTVANSGHRSTHSDWSRASRSSKAKRPLRAPDIHHGRPVSNPAPGKIEIRRKDNLAEIRGRDGRRRMVDAQDVIKIKQYPAEWERIPLPTLAQQRVLDMYRTTRPAAVAWRREHAAGGKRRGWTDEARAAAIEARRMGAKAGILNPDARDLGVRVARGSSIRIKAGEVISGMFSSQRTYPLIPSPNGKRRSIIAEVPQRRGTPGGGGVIARDDWPTKGWVVRDGKRVFVPLAQDFRGEKPIRDAAGRSVIVPKQDTSPRFGLRPRPIDQTVRTGIPSRASLGMEAMEEMSQNPPATRDPDPWRAPAARPHPKNPMARMGADVPDGGLGMEPRGLRPDDVRRSLRGVGRALGRTQRQESPLPSNVVDPEPYRKGWRRTGPTSRVYDVPGEDVHVDRTGYEVHVQAEGVIVR